MTYSFRIRERFARKPDRVTVDRRPDWIFGRICAVAVALVLIFGCSESSSFSPTKPKAPSHVLTFLGGNIYNTAGDGTIKKVSLIFDGKTLSTVSSDTPVRAALFLFNGDMEIGKGDHKFSFKILDQTVTPTQYELEPHRFFMVTNVKTREIRTYWFRDPNHERELVTGLIPTGGSLDFRFEVDF